MADFLRNASTATQVVVFGLAIIITSYLAAGMAGLIIFGSFFKFAHFGLLNILTIGGVIGAVLAFKRFEKNRFVFVLAFTLSYVVINVLVEVVLLALAT